MDLSKVYNSDKELESEGVWVLIDSESALKVARIGNPNFKKLASKISQQCKIIAKHTGDIPREKLIELLAKTILLDWKGIKDLGEKIEYSVENAIKMMTKYEKFMELVVEIANSNETYVRQDVEESKEILKKY